MTTRQTCTGHALFILIIGVLTANAQKRPPNYSQDDMPVTGFNCREKIVGGYYADPETDCQMFHVCVHLPGVGIQDFRFLCPNDTAFDQEHQICDDWYNIDCELSASFYGDNFDLYRIGANNEVKKAPISHKGTPIPLGPSTTIKPWTPPKKNQYDEDDYKNSGNDILRGSHSSNFYSSKNRGREDLEDSDEDTPNVGAQRQQVRHPNEIRKQKTLVRKVTNKRPVTQPPTTVPSTFAPPTTIQYNTNYNQNQNTKLYNQNTQQYQYTGNKVTKSRGNINYNTYTIKATKPTTTTPNIYQRINNLTESSYEQDVSQEAPVTQLYDLNKTYKNAQNFRQHQAANAGYRTSKYNAAKNAFSASPSPSVPAVTSQTESIRLPSTEYLQNIAQSYQQPASLINNQLQDTSSNNAYSQPPPSQYDIYKKAQQPSVGTQSTFANYDNYLQPQYNTYKQPSSYPTTVNVPQTSAAQQSLHYDTRSQSTDTYAYQSYSTQPTYVQPNTTSFDYYKYYQTSTPAAFTQKTQSFYTASPTFNYYQPQQPSSTAPPPPKYDPYATFQKANEKYDDEEFLKTASSSNLKPSDLNAIHNLKKQSYINATLKAAYSVEQPKQAYNVQSSTSSTAKIINSPKPAINYNSINTVKLATQYKTPSAAQQAYSPKPSSANTNSNNNNATSSNSHDYDYAYYDNAGSSEYDQLDAVEGDFARIQKVQK